MSRQQRGSRMPLLVAAPLDRAGSRPVPVPSVTSTPWRCPESVGSGQPTAVRASRPRPRAVRLPPYFREELRVSALHLRGIIEIPLLTYLDGVTAGGVCGSRAEAYRLRELAHRDARPVREMSGYSFGHGSCLPSSGRGSLCSATGRRDTPRWS